MPVACFALNASFTAAQFALALDDLLLLLGDFELLVTLSIGAGLRLALGDVFDDYILDLAGGD